MIHDILAEIVVSGEKQNITSFTIKLNKQERKLLNKTHDIFTYLTNEKKLLERASLLKRAIFLPLLSDMIHCVFETLETSRKGKLNISFMLIRKPLQESLYVLESMLLDELDFTENLNNNPLKLQGRKAGGVQVHKKNIQQIIIWQF